MSTLSTFVPVDLLISLIKNKVQQNHNLWNRKEVKTCKTCHHTTTVLSKITCFLFQRQPYENIVDAVMGLPVNHVVVNFFMEDFENMTL